MMAAPAAASGSGRHFVAAVEARLRAARALPGAPAREASCHALLADAFDAAALARTAAGPRWDGFDAPARAEMTGAAMRRLQRECPALLARPDPGVPEVVREREAPPGLRLVTRLARTDGNALMVVWVMAPGGPMGWRLEDLVADGVSMAATLRSEFDARLAARDGDIRAAIADLGTEARR